MSEDSSQWIQLSREDFVDAIEHDMLSQPGIRLAVGPQTVKHAPRQIQRAAYPARRYPGEARFQKRTAHR